MKPKDFQQNKISATKRLKVSFVGVWLLSFLLTLFLVWQTSSFSPGGLILLASTLATGLIGGYTFLKFGRQIKELEGKLIKCTEENKNQIKEFEQVRTQLEISKEAVQETHDFYVNVMNQLPFDLVVLDNEHRYVYINPLSIRDPELRKWLIGKDDYDYCRYRNKPKDIADFRRKTFHEVVASKKMKSWEAHHITRSGEDEYILRCMYPWIDEDGNLKYMIGFGYNITERKKAELELEKARSIAVAASKAKSEFLSTMSHEIRTPLNAVIGVANLLKLDNPRPDQEEQLDVLQFSAKNLLALVNDILDFSKIEAGRLQLEHTSFNMRQLVTGIYHSHLPAAEQKGLNIKIEVHEDICTWLQGDPTRLAQILNNLISNAIKFTREGWVKLSIQLISASSDMQKLLFAVEDTGIGIPKDKIEHIFEKFSQAESSTTREFGGTGLGLSIIRGLLKLMESEIKVESEMGMGSSFSFEINLPIGEYPEVESSKDNSRSTAVQTLKNKRILVAEDNGINFRIVHRFLTIWGAECEHADNGKVALEKVQTDDFDLVLMDLQMPVMDGFEASLAIRELSSAEKSQIPIIALSANAFSEVEAQVYDAGINAFATKPFVPDELKEVLTRTLSGKGSELVSD